MEYSKFVLIIGAMKCGTSSLFHYLAEHPEVAASQDKEPHFFSYDDRFKKGIKWYRKLWQWEPENTIAMEASTTYAMNPKYPNVIDHINELTNELENADFRFIYIMRHPFTRIKSHMIHLLSGGHQKKAEIIEEHLAFTEYARQIDLFVNAFGRDRIHLLLLEDLNRDPLTELQKICHFLNIDPDYEFQSIKLVMNSQQTMNLHPIVRRVYQIPFVKSIGSLVSPEIRQKLYKPFSRKEPYKVSLSAAEKQLILDRLQPDLERLKLEYGIDVDNKWDLSIGK
jgi:hypothetical protein